MSLAAARGLPALHLLADDLTGALDSAAAFAPGVPVHLGHAPAQHAAGVVAVATESRDLPSEALPALLAPLLPWFTAPGLAFKKVDSLLRGNTFHECAHLWRAGGFDGLIFAPAFPAQRRVTQAGRHGLLPAPDSPLRGWTAIGEPLVASFAALGLSARVSAADDPPWPRLAGSHRSARAPLPAVWIPDATCDADLLRLARRATDAALEGRWLWAGSAGLAQALAASAGASPASVPPDDAGSVAGRTVIVGASHHPVVRGQWARLRDHLAAVPGSVAPIVVREGEPQALEAAWRALAAGGAGLAALELAPTAALSREEAVTLLAAQMGAFVAQAARPAQLLVLGGDTLLALCRAAGATSLRTAPARRPGWGSARLVGGPWDGLRCHTRSGAFGDPEDLWAMLQTLR